MSIVRNGIYFFMFLPFKFLQLVGSIFFDFFNLEFLHLMSGLLFNIIFLIFTLFFHLDHLIIGTERRAHAQQIVRTTSRLSTRWRRRC